MYQKIGKGREADKVSHRDKIGCVCGGDALCGCNSRIGYKAKLLQIKNRRGIGVPSIRKLPQGGSCSKTK